jgi:nucleoside-diphosphate-sugar epimerase
MTGLAARLPAPDNTRSAIPGLLSPEFPSIRFAGKFADVEALNRGDARALQPTLDAETASHWAGIERPAGGNGLVVGGNGFVGAHLVAHLSTLPQIAKVWALVRGDRTPPRDRLDATLKKYRVSAVDWSKIEVVEGTPTAPRFGLPAGLHGELSAGVDLVYNCASSTDYSVGYLDLRSDWVLSLLRLVEFCADGGPKHLTYLGSIGRFFYQVAEDFVRPDSWWYSGYAQMKWVNAQLMLSLGAQGMPVTLCDTHYVLGATTVGLDPGRTYSLWRVLELAKALGVVWDGAGMNYVPVDVLVGAVTANSLAARPLTRILPRNVDPYRTSLWAAGLGIDVVPWQFFVSEVQERAPRAMGSLFSSDIDQLVGVVNRPPALFPPGYTFSWPTTDALFELYFSRIAFRNPGWVKPRVRIADLAALEARAEST